MLSWQSSKRRSQDEIDLLPDTKTRVPQILAVKTLCYVFLASFKVKWTNKEFFVMALWATHTHTHLLHTRIHAHCHRILQLGCSQNLCKCTSITCMCARNAPFITMHTRTHIAHTLHAVNGREKWMNAQLCSNCRGKWWCWNEKYFNRANGNQITKEWTVKCIPMAVGCRDAAKINHKYA